MAVNFGDTATAAGKTFGAMFGTPRVGGEQDTSRRFRWRRPSTSAKVAT